MDNQLEERWSAEILRHGFTAVPNILLTHREYLGLTITDLYVLIAIEKHRWDSSQKPWPSLKSLAKITDLSTRTVARSTRHLEDLHLIRKVHRTGTSCLYDFEPLIDELNDIAAEIENMSSVRDTGVLPLQSRISNEISQQWQQGLDDSVKVIRSNYEN